MLVQGPNNKLLRSSETGFKTFLVEESILKFGVQLSIE